MYKRRWWVYFLLFTLCLINYIDRMNMSMAEGPISTYLHLSPGMMGLVMSSFLWTYTIFLIPSGLITDKIGSRRTAAIGIVLWSVASFCTGLASTVGILFASRLLMGMGESTTYPTSLKTIREWVPLRERGFATAIFDAGVSIGPGIGALLIGWLISRFDWRVSFFVTSLFGLVWVVFWLIFFHNKPEEAKWLKDQERQEILTQRGMVEEKKSVSIAHLLKYKSMWGVALTQGCIVYAQYLFLTWLPSYLQTSLHVSVMTSGIFTALPYIISGVFMVFMGRFSDRLLNRKNITSGQRRNMVIISLFLSAVVLFAPLVKSVVLIEILVTFSLAFNSTSIALNHTLSNDLLQIQSSAGSASAITIFGGNVFGLLAPIVTGFVIQFTHSYVGAFVIAGALLIIGAVISFTMTRKPIGEVSTAGEAATVPQD
jgi:MFS family permease